MLSSQPVFMLFANLLSLHIVTFLMCFILVHVPFFSSRCMLELKVCHLLQSSKSPLTGFLCSIGWRITGFFKHSPHTNCISNSAILCNNYILLLSDLCACVHVKKNGVAKEAIVLQWAVRTTSWDFKPGKKQCAGALLRGKCCCMCKSHCERVTQFWTSPSEEEEEERKTFWPSGDFLVWYFRDAF